MKYYVIAGEASGDLHGSNLLKELKKLDDSAEFRAWGGDKMEDQGAVLAKHYKDLAFMGFVEVLFNLRTILRNISFCKKDLIEYNPDVLILIDYPGFNLRIAEFATQNNIRVVYYVSPQIWAWKENRIHKIKKSIDQMFVILPFEKEFYAKHDYPVEYLGHPLLDDIDLKEKTKEDLIHFRRENQLSEKPIIALLPGSRKQEIKRMLGVMIDVSKEYPNYQFVIAGAPHISESFFAPFLSGNVRLLMNKTKELYQYSEAGLITSGTATLEAALYNLPEVVCYKASPISYWIAKRLVKIKYISLVNLILDKETVKELIQGDLNKKNVSAELGKIIIDGINRQQQLDDYSTLRKALGNRGASERIAEQLLKSIPNPQ